MLSFIAIFTITLYFIVACLQILRLSHYSNIKTKWGTILGFVAIIMHAFLLYRWIDVGSGQNLTFFNTLSQVCWLAVGLIWLMTIKKPLANLGIVLYPLAGISILFVMLFSGSYIVDTKADPKTLLHILLSFITISILIIAAIQAVFLALFNSALRKKHTNLLNQSLPPLQMMERVLFQFITLGFCMLTAVIISGFCFLSKLYQVSLWHHMTFAIMAWIIFGILMIGQIFFGWRGKITIRWTLIGVVLLLIAYATSQIWLR